MNTSEGLSRSGCEI